MTCRYLDHNGCVASGKRNQLLVFGDRNLSGPLLSFIRANFSIWSSVAGLKDLYDF